jgi:inosine-uridine nucleoside N-ribohydrolase
MATLALALALALIGQGEPAPRPEPVPVIFDTDMGNDIDDVFALALLHGLADRGECRLLAVTSSQPHPLSGPMCDAINAACGRAEVPVGVLRPDPATRPGPYLAKVLGPDAAEPFPHHLKDGRDAPEAVALLRKTLASQPDGPVVVVCVGFATNLAALLRSEADAASPLDGRALVARKVARLVMMAGTFDAPRPEFNVEQDVASARAVFEGWPTPIVVSPFEVGIRAQYPREPRFGADAPADRARLLTAIDLATFGQPQGFPAWDLTAALHAVRPDGGYFTLSPPGTVRLDARGVTTLEPSPDGRHRYLGVEERRIPAIQGVYTELVERPAPPR